MNLQWHHDQQKLFWLRAWSFPCETIWLVVSTPLKNISQNGNLPQIGVKIKNVWNQHLAIQQSSKIQLFGEQTFDIFFYASHHWGPGFPRSPVHHSLNALLWRWRFGTRGCDDTVFFSYVRGLCQKYPKCTLPEANSSPLKFGGCETSLSFWGPAYFQGLCLLVSSSRFARSVEKMVTYGHLLSGPQLTTSSQKSLIWNGLPSRSLTACPWKVTGTQ